MEISILTLVAICLALSFMLGEIFYRLKYPRLIGQIIAGIIFGQFMFFLFTPRILEVVDFLSDLGMIFLLLIVGLELDLPKFRKTGKDSLIVGLFCFLLPFTLGFILMKSFSSTNLAAIVVGACLAITAEGTTLNVLIDLKALNTKVGNIMVGAGIIDDVFEIAFLVFVLVFTGQTATYGFENLSTFQTILMALLKLAIFVGVIFVLYKLMPKILDNLQREKSRVATFSAVLIIALVIAILSQSLILSPIIGAFIAGIIINLTEKDRKEEHIVLRELKIMTFGFVIPFLFIKIGLAFRLDNLLQNVWISIMIILVAIIGKIFGAFIAKPFTSLTTKQAYLIGWGMNSRGAMELIIASLAYDTSRSLISNDFYSAIVAMAVITTLMFPFIIKYYVKKDRSVLD